MRGEKKTHTHTQNRAEVSPQDHRLLAPLIKHPSSSVHLQGHTYTLRRALRFFRTKVEMNGICYLGNKTSAAVVNDTESQTAGNESGDNVRMRKHSFPWSVKRIKQNIPEFSKQQFRNKPQLIVSVDKKV